jgi:hypothetical protein
MVSYVCLPVAPLTARTRCRLEDCVRQQHRLSSREANVFVFKLSSCHAQGCCDCCCASSSFCLNLKFIAVVQASAPFLRSISIFSLSLSFKCWSTARESSLGMTTRVFTPNTVSVLEVPGVAFLKLILTSSCIKHCQWCACAYACFNQ